MTKSINFKSYNNDGDILEDITFGYKRLSDLSEEFKKRNIIIGENVYLTNGVTIGNNVVIGENSVILSSTIPENTEIGEDNNILTSYFNSGLKTGWNVTINGASIGYNCSIGNRVTIYDGVTIANNCDIGSYSKLLGSRCYINNNVKIGENVKIDKNVHIKAGEVIDNDIEYRSIIFNGPGTTGCLVYWGTDEILFDDLESSHNIDPRTKNVNYSFEEFKNEVFGQPQWAWPAFFSQKEIEFYEKCFTLIEQMHENEMMKPAESLCIRRRKIIEENFQRSQPPDWLEPNYPKDYCENNSRPVDDWMDGDPSNYWNID